MELSCIYSIISCFLPLLAMYALVLGPLISDRKLHPSIKKRLRTQRLWVSLAILLYLLGGVLLVSMGQAVGMTIRSRNWPQAEGVVMSSHYEEFKANTSDGILYSYKASLSYQYSVDGMTHISNRPRLIHPFVMFYNEQDAVQFVQQYAPENRVVVFYDPDNPEEAVLDRSIDISPEFFLICLILLAGGTASLRQAIKMRNSEAKPIQKNEYT